MSDPTVPVGAPHEGDDVVALLPDALEQRVRIALGVTDKLRVAYGPGIGFFAGAAARVLLAKYGRGALLELAGDPATASAIGDVLAAAVWVVLTLVISAFVNPSGASSPRVAKVQNASRIGSSTQGLALLAAKGEVHDPVERRPLAPLEAVARAAGDVAQPVLVVQADAHGLPPAIEDAGDAGT